VKYAHEVMDLMGAYPKRSFRMVELVRHVTHGRTLTVREREAARKAVKRVLDALVAAGSIHISNPAPTQGAFSEYSVSHYWDMRPTKAGQEVGQYVRELAS
jgi:hypothetical protein